jgi:hypothetical protein
MVTMGRSFSAAAYICGPAASSFVACVRAHAALLFPRLGAASVSLATKKATHGYHKIEIQRQGMI